MAVVNGVTTTFSYDGGGNRLLMSVAGEVTTYTVDYGGTIGRVLFEEGSHTKHYIYGYVCLAEVVDAGSENEEEYFYLSDGDGMVRQTSDTEGEISSAWTYTPEGMVLVGEEGPVTNLGCGAGAIYDWSTGLIFKSGRYFDPNTGIWLTMSGVVIYQGWRQSGGRKRKNRKGKN